LTTWTKLTTELAGDEILQLPKPLPTRSAPSGHEDLLQLAHRPAPQA